MTNGTDTKPRNRAERDADRKSRQRLEQAGIVEGLRTILDSSEQLLGFARGRIAGGFRGKLSVGPEAFFAPFVNIALTERRFVLQHIHSDDGRPSEILPHFYDLGDIAAITFTDIETFGGEPACRLVLRLTNDHHSRLRLSGQSNIASAQAIAEVFRSLTTRPHASVTTPTQRVCARCQHVMDQPSRFCPYCGTVQPTEQTAEAPRSEAMPDETAFAPSPDWEDTQDIELIAPVPVNDSAETPVAPTPITVPANTIDEAGITEMIAPVAPAPPTGEAPPAAEVAPSVASLLETPAPPVPPAPPAVPNVPLPPFSVVAPMPPMPAAVPPPAAPVPPAETNITSGMEPGDVGFTANGSAFFHAPHDAEGSELPAPASATDTPQATDDTTEIADATQPETPASVSPMDDTTEPLDAPPAPPAFGAPAATPAEPAHNEANPNTQGDSSR